MRRAQPAPPLTCGNLHCGQTEHDGCGGILSCGTCTPPQTCGGGGTQGVCGEWGREHVQSAHVRLDSPADRPATECGSLLLLRHVHAARDLRRRRGTGTVRSTGLHAEDVHGARRDVRPGRRRVRWADAELRHLREQRNLRRRRDVETSADRRTARLGPARWPGRTAGRWRTGAEGSCNAARAPDRTPAAEEGSRASAEPAARSERSGIGRRGTRGGGRRVRASGRAGPRLVLACAARDGRVRTPVRGNPSSRLRSRTRARAPRAGEE